MDSWVQQTLPHVYGAARRAACDEIGARETTERVFAALGGETPPADALVARAVRLAVRSHPHPAFASMDVPAREAVALARLLKWDVDRVAAELGIDRAEVKALLNRGLHALTEQSRMAAAA